jgi:hypothetical protein
VVVLGQSRALVLLESCDLSRHGFKLALKPGNTPAD